MAAEWHGFEVKAPGKDLLEKTRGVLESLVTYLEVVKAVLETIQLFLVDFGNPVRALIKALLQLIQQLLESLKQTGLFAYYDFPDPQTDPDFKGNVGGYPAFISRFKASLLDGRDPNRPQPAAGITKSGFVLIVADAETVGGLVRLVKILMQFFGKDFLSPKYPAPAGLKVVGVGAKGDKILRVASVFSDPPQKLSVEWTLPGSSPANDASFEGLVTAVGQEFIPPKFLIEKSTVQNGTPVNVTVETPFEDKSGLATTQVIPAVDENRDPFRLFEKYIVIDPSHSAGTFFLGQLGTFRYIDSDVEIGKTYFYRVRTFSGQLAINPDGSLAIDPVGNLTVDVPTGRQVLNWPGTDPADPPVMGRPSPVVAGRLPVVPAKYDVIGVLEALFKTAYSLGFHEQVGAGATFDPTTGDPTGGTDVHQVGHGSLSDLAGPLANFVPVPPVGTPQRDPITGTFPELPHQESIVKFFSATSAQRVASQMLGVTGFDALGGFKTLMDSMPYPVPGAHGYLAGATTLTDLVLGFTFTRDDFPAAYDAKVYDTFAFGFSSVPFRKDILAAIQYVKSFATHGSGKDWVSISVLRDIIPWSGQLINELLNRIDALLEAFKGVEDEINDFINVIIRKIDTLERFLQFLIQILNYLDAFNASYSILKVPETTGGIQDWIEQIDTSTGDKPKSGPAGYTGGVCLAYAGPNVDAFVTAFGIIF